MRKLTRADQQNIRQVIRDQLHALSQLDGERALRKLTLERRTGDGRRFLTSIANEFPQLTQAWTAEFGPTGTVDDVWAQPVRVTAWNRSHVDALFLLRQAQDGTWLIDGCVCRPPEGEPARPN